MGQVRGPQDVVLLLDVSASLKDAKPIVDVFLKDRLKFGDTFHLIAFSNTSRLVMAQRIMGNADMESVRRQMLALSEATAKPDVRQALAFAQKYVASLSTQRQKKVTLVTSADIPQPAQTSAAFKRADASFEQIKPPQPAATAPKPAVTPQSPTAQQPKPAQPPPAARPAVPPATTPQPAAQPPKPAQPPPAARPVVPPATAPQPAAQPPKPAQSPPAAQPAVPPATAPQPAAQPPKPVQPPSAAQPAVPPTTAPQPAAQPPEPPASLRDSPQAPPDAPEPKEPKKSPRPPKIITPQAPSEQAVRVSPKPSQTRAPSPRALNLLFVVCFFFAFFLLLMVRHCLLSVNRAFALVSTGFDGPILLSLFVEDQNTNIGRRNIHILARGASLGLGGGKSDFLIFLVPLPQNIAKVRFDGDHCSFVPRMKGFFPEITTKTLPDCIGKTIKIRSERNYDLFIRIISHENPFAVLNNLFLSIKLPGR